MNNLIIYTSRYGATTTCVQKLQAQLTGQTTAINLKQGTVPNLAEFDTIILGGSIYAGTTQKELRQFAQTHLQALLTKPVFLFLSSAFRQADDFQRNFPAALCQHATAKGLLGGEMNMAKLNLFEKLITKIVGQKGEPPHIHEEEIAAFAKTINERKYGK